MAASQMSPVEWAKRPLEKYTEFSGRAPRAEYWWYTLALIIAFLIANVLEGLVGLGDMVAGMYGPLTLLLALATIAPGLAVTARRLHDTSRSGWWMLVAIVPYLAMGVMTGIASSSGSMADVEYLGAVTIVAGIGGLVLLVFMVLPSKPGENRYGPNPYGEGAGGTVAAE